MAAAQVLDDGGIVSIPSLSTLPLPVIDLTNLQRNSRSHIVREIGCACRDWGFFYVVNHGIPSDLANRMLEVAAQFFELPNEEKSKYSSDDYLTNGLISFGKSFNPAVEKVHSWREFLWHKAHPVEEFVGTWPLQPSSYREVAAEYSKEVRSLALQLFSAVSESLGLVPDFLEKAFDPSQLLILNNYPPCANPEVILGIAPHSDIGSLTILLPNEVPGLQIRHNGEWIDVVPIKDALCILVADQIQILTNGQYQSVEHRALANAIKMRMSIAASFGPSFNKIIGPAREFVDESNPPRYEATMYSEYMKIVQAKGLDGKAIVESRKILGLK